MRLEHNWICTWNSEVETGSIYLYKDGKLEGKVKVVHTSQQKEGICLSLKVVAKPKNSFIVLGEELDVLSYWKLKDAK